MGQKDADGSGLGLSLGLGSFGAQNRSSNDSPPPPPQPQQPAALTTPAFPLNFFKPPSPYFFHNNDKSQSSILAFQAPSSADLNKETTSFRGGIDVNRQPITVIDVEEENAVVSSPNSTVSTTSLSGKRSEREDRDDVESLEVDEDDGDASGRKKLRLSKEQAVVLEETFKEHSTLNPKQKLALAKQLNLRPRQVEVWFQNRRARTKLKQTEVDCEYLRRCCENLTEENRRLQREVSELRALKLSPQFYSNMKPPTTLTMCPQCERVAVSSSSSLSSTTTATANGGGQPPPTATKDWWR